MLSSFTVKPLNDWSDHTPLSFSLHCRLNKPVLSDETATTHKWDNLREAEFRVSLIRKLPEFNTLTSLENKNPTNRDDINILLNNFTNIVCEVGERLFCKNVYCTKKYITHIRTSLL